MLLEDANIWPLETLGKAYEETSVCGRPTISHAAMSWTHSVFMPTLCPWDRHSLLWPAVSPGKGLISYTVLRKAMADSFAPNLCLPSAAAETQGGRRYPNCFPSNNFSQTMAANLKPCVVTRALASEPSFARILVPFWSVKLMCCHLWEKFLVRKVNI